MSNSLGSRPIKVDTPGSTPLFTNWMKIENIIFTEYTADTQKFSVQDQNTNPIFEGSGNSDLSPVVSWKIGWVNGLMVPTLQGGQVEIYVQ